MKGRIRIGISGWTYAGWRGTFYPPDLTHARELAYASHRALDLGLVPDVDGDRQRASARPFDFFRGRVNRARQLRMRHLGFCGDDDPRAIARRPKPDCLPDAAAGAGDEQRLA